MNKAITSSRLPPAARALLPRTAGQALRHTAVALSLLLCAAGPAVAQVSIGVYMPGVSIGINMPVYPQLVRVPNYPVYYAPGAQANFFFYDGLYWVYQQDNWYASSWYNGPWRPMSPQMVPAVRAAHPGALLPQSADLFPGLATQSTAALGRTLGQ